MRIDPLQVGDFVFNGRTFEEYLLGCDGYDERRIPRFEEALMASIYTQPDGFPGMPETGIKDVLSSVRRFFGTNEAKDIKVFSTIRKPLDYHGVDCFFYLRETAVLVDVTRNPRKFRVRSHLVLTDDIIGSNRRIDEFAEQVADRLADPTHYRLPLNACFYISKKYGFGNRLTT